MPSIVGILMSVTITSYRAPSILLFAACPDCTVSTRWPSRRKAMSSISQMERSSSQTRILALRSPSRCPERRLTPLLSGGRRAGTRDGGSHQRQCTIRIQCAQLEDEGGSLARFGACPNFAFMRLHDLINDGQSQAGSAFEIGLERLEDFFSLLRSHSRARVGKGDLPVIADEIESNGKPASAVDAVDTASAASPTSVHGPHCVLAKIPKYLLDLVAVRNRPGVGFGKPAFNGDSRVFRDHAVLHQGQRVFHQLNEVDFVEVILLGARIREEVGDDAVQPLGFACHDGQKATVLLVHLRNAG